MSTKGTRWILTVAAGLVAAGLLSSALAAEEKKASASSTATDLKIDLALKALRMPVLQPVLVLPQGKGAPAWPLYKEQPPAAQNDFRPPPPEPEADPDQAMRDWLEYLRKALENADLTDQKSAEQLIAEIDQYTRIMGLSDAIVANKYWFAAYLDLGETLRASATSLEPLASFKLAETIDRMRTQLEQTP